MARTIELTEPERKILLQLTQEEWNRLNKIRELRDLNHDPILTEQLAVEDLQAKLR